MSEDIIRNIPCPKCESILTLTIKCDHESVMAAYKEAIEFYANPDNWAIHKDSEGKDYCPMTFKTYIPAQKVLRNHA